MTLRDKKMIVAVIFFGLIAISVAYGIMPLRDELEAKNLLIDELNMQMELYEKLLREERIIVENYNESLETYNALIETYPEVMHNEAVDDVLTAFLLENGLPPLSLSMGEIYDFEGRDYSMPVSASSDVLAQIMNVVSEVGLGAIAMEGFDAGAAEAAAAQSNSDEAIAYIQQVDAQMSVKGTFEQAKTIMDLTNTVESFRITAISIVPEDGIPLRTGLHDIEISFEVPMTEPVVIG